MSDPLYSPQPQLRLPQKIITTLKIWWQHWLAAPLWQRLIIAAGLLLVLAGLIFGAWYFLNRQAPQTSQPPVIEISQTTPPPEESTPTPPNPPTEEPPSPPPSNGGAQQNNNNSGGNGAAGGGNSGGNNGGGGTPAPSFPNASNTGPTGCSSYTQYLGTLNIDVDGTTLNCIELHGTLTINANNVTVQNSILKGDSWWGVRVGNTKTDTANFKLLHNRLYTIPGLGPDNGGYDYGVSQESTGYMEIAYNDISGYKDGVTTANSYIHDNYIHNLSQFTGAHTQAIYVYTGPSQVKIEHNTLINDSPQSQATAAIYIAPDDGHQNDRIITNNFLAGGAYTIYGGDSTATNIVVTKNKFSTQIWPDSGYFGWAAYWWPNNVGNVWSDNTWADGQNINQTINP